jgi:hypothetical protein
MSILDKLREKNQSVKEEKVTLNQSDEQSNLNLDEITFLLTSIKDLTFKVSDVELVYSTIIKLQSQFLNKSSNISETK